jgi:hypothetical protein
MTCLSGSIAASNHADEEWTARRRNLNKRPNTEDPRGPVSGWEYLCP